MYKGREGKFDDKKRHTYVRENDLVSRETRHFENLKKERKRQEKMGLSFVSVHKLIKKTS